MTRSLTEVTGSSAKSMDQSGGRQRSRARRRRMRRIGKEMRQTAVGGKLKEMGKKATRSEVGRKAMREGNVVDLGEDVRFKGRTKARGHATEEHLNKVPVRQISAMEGKEIDIMLPGETILVKGYVVALTWNIGAVGKVGEGRVATSRSKKGKNDVAIIRRLEDDEEARIGGEVGGFVPKEMGEGGREGSGKVVENAKGKERRSRIGRP